MSPTMFSMRLVHVFNVFDVGIQCLYMFINVCQCVSYVFQYKRGAYSLSRGARGDEIQPHETLETPKPNIAIF